MGRQGLLFFYYAEGLYLLEVISPEYQTACIQRVDLVERVEEQVCSGVIYTLCHTFRRPYIVLQHDNF
jgi:hypothetical protein